MLSKAPIDTAKYTRDGQFDYASAWREVRPMWDALPESSRVLLVAVRMHASEQTQDRNCDLPWPRDGVLRAAFGRLSTDELRLAASVIQALGHWMPGDAPAEDRALFSGVPQDGAYWKFERYADQSIREREGRPWSGREPRPPSALEVACSKLGITAKCSAGAPVTDLDDEDDWRKRARAWTVRLDFGKRQLTVPFWQGEAHAHTKPPTPADVLLCLLSDASSYEAASDFEDWARDLGMDPDSRKAERTYQQVERIAKKLRTFLGDSFDRLAKAAGDS